MADPAVYGFLPWVRSGLASMAKTAPTQNYVSLQVALAVNGTAAPTVGVRLFGPGQVTGIDPRAITRLEPRPYTTSFEPNYFPTVEFATADFPWMFSPAVANGAVLKPWLCLVVVKVQPGVAITPRSNALSLLQFSAPAVPVDELPNLDEIAFWAHAQIAGAKPASDGDVSAALADPNSGRVSRIVCPRKLDPNTAFIACLVPTYDAGVQAGISPDLPADDSNVAPAWTSTTAAPFALPVYASWTFSTGDAGDFASLASKLRPPAAPLDVGQLPMDESAPGFGLPAFPGLALSLEGALKAPQTNSSAWPVGVEAQFEQALGPILSPPAGPDPIVAPPMYGVWPAAGTQPVWMHELNFDPRMRAAAGIGVTVVRADQQNLMASAWDQFQQLRSANQRLRQFQLARVVAQTTRTKHISTLEGAGSFLQLTRPLHGRVRLTLGTLATLDSHLAATRIAAGTLSPTFRRLVRRRGPLGRRLFAAATPPSQIIERLNEVTGTARALTIVAQLIAPAGTALLDSVSTATPLAALTPAAVAAAPGWGAGVAARVPGSTAPPVRPPESWKIDPESPVWLKAGVKTFPVAPAFPTVFSDYQQMEARFRAAATQVTTYISERSALISDAPEEPPLVGTLLAAQTMVVTAVDPTITLVARAAAQFVLATSGDPLRPRIGAPQFPRPMSRALTAQQILPGVEKVPDETAALLVTNPRFIEAYMVGLNDEMRREVAWRQYPVESTATFFSNFWGAAADIPPIATWPVANHLGATADTHDAQVVLLIRGEVLRRYPNALISAIPATIGSDNQKHLGADEDELLPVFRGSIEPDMTFFGFALTEAQAKAGLGYYFVLAEHPSEPRFGLEPAPKGTTLLSWNDLAWTQVNTLHNHLSIATPPTATAPAAAWGANAAQQAFITYRQPVRLALLASALLG